MHRVLRVTTSLPIRVGLGAGLLVYYFASIQEHCEWGECTVYYNWDKPSVVAALVLSVVLLGHAAFDLVRSMMKKRPNARGFETPPPPKPDDLTRQHTKLQSD